MVNRRDFLATAGTGLVALVLTPIVSACGGDDDNASSVSPTTPVSCDGAGETSTVVDGHSHTVCVPNADIDDPPAAGSPYVTSVADGHQHDVLLTADELTTVANGGSVTVTTTVELGHTHDFSIHRGSTISDDPSPITPMPYPV